MRSRAAQSARKVLIVDDNRDAAVMVSILLTRAGHQVEIAVDAAQALAAVAVFRPHIAILDIGLPVMDGYALARELRARLGEGTPILVALSGYGQEQDQLRSVEAGFVRHLVKPVDARRLLELVDTLGKN
jgi:CheY-like chemotaxis protein